MMGMFIHVDTSGFNLQAELDVFLAKGGGLDLAMKSAALTVLGEMRVRIHENGQAADGSDIGAYSVKPLYVNPNNSPRKFPPAGKSGKTVFASGQKKGQPHKTKYFSGGYGDFKSTIGRNPGKVNLFLTGTMANQFVVIETPQGWGLGWMNDLLTTRAFALEMKYGKAIWECNQSEEKLLTDTIHSEIKL